MAQAEPTIDEAERRGRLERAVRALLPRDVSLTWRSGKLVLETRRVTWASEFSRAEVFDLYALAKALGAKV